MSSWQAALWVRSTRGHGGEADCLLCPGLCCRKWGEGRQLAGPPLPTQPPSAGFGKWVTVSVERGTPQREAVPAHEANQQWPPEEKRGPRNPDFLLFYLLTMERETPEEGAVQSSQPQPWKLVLWGLPRAPLTPIHSTGVRPESPAHQEAQTERDDITRCGGQSEAETSPPAEGNMQPSPPRAVSFNPAASPQPLLEGPTLGGGGVSTVLASGERGPPPGSCR